MRHSYQPELNPQMGGDCAVCGNRQSHQIHEVPISTVSELCARVRETFARTPFVGETERLARELHRLFSGGARMVRLSELIEPGAGVERVRLIVTALSPLTTSSYAVIDMVGVDRQGDLLPAEEMPERVRAGRDTDQTWLALVPRPGFLALSPF